MTIVPSADRILEALYQRSAGGTPVLLAPNHHTRGAMMDHAVFAELCFGFCQAGHCTLRFNYGGVGASTAGSTKRDQSRDEEDLRSAHQHLRETAQQKCMLIAHGYACRLLKDIEQEFSRIALIDPQSDDLEDFIEGTRASTYHIFLSSKNAERQALKESIHDLPHTVIANTTAGFQRGLPQLREAVVNFLSR